MTYPQKNPQAVSGPCRQPAQHAANKRNAKELAKTGMAVSLGALVMTGLMRTPQARLLHIAAGTAMIGFCIWHTTLYKPQTKK